jgi:hypothetical protein
MSCTATYRIFVAGSSLRPARRWQDRVMFVAAIVFRLILGVERRLMTGSYIEHGIPGGCYPASQ